MNICNEKDLCSTMHKYIERDETKQGFHLWRAVESGKVVVKGIMYHQKNARPTILNRCPFCEAELKWGIPK